MGGWWLKAVPLQQSRCAYRAPALVGRGKAEKWVFLDLKEDQPTIYWIYPKQGFSIRRAEIMLAKFGSLKPIWSRDLPSEPKTL